MFVGQSPKGNIIPYSDDRLIKDNKIDSMIGIVEIKDEADITTTITRFIDVFTLDCLPHLTELDWSAPWADRIIAVIDDFVATSIAGLEQMAINVGVAPTIAFKSRIWPVNVNSPNSWKSIAFGERAETNWIIKAAQAVINNNGPVENKKGNVYPNSTEPEWKAKLDAGMAEAKELGLEKFVRNRLEAIGLPPASEGFFRWLADNIANVSEGSEVEKEIMLLAVTAANYVPRPRGVPSQDSDRKVQSARELTCYPHSENVVSVSRHLMSIGPKANNAFMMWVCAHLYANPRGLLIQKADIMRRVTLIMTMAPAWTDLVRMTMAAVMADLTEAESEVNRHVPASLSHVYVLTADMIAALPVFDTPAPYIPLAIEHIKYNVPWRIDGPRVPVAEIDIPARLNAVMVAKDAKFDMVKDIPWQAMGLVLTGSRYAGACWVGPRERTYASLEQYVEEYIGVSTTEIHALTRAYYGSGILAPLLVAYKDAADLPDGKKDEPDVEYVEATPGSPGETIFDMITALRKPTSVFTRRTDIDIGVVNCTRNMLDKKIVEFIKYLRQFGGAFAVRNDKIRGNHTWTVISPLFKHTIDFFNVTGSAIGMVTSYMAGYPRAYFDGLSYIGTAEYVCARMSGVNYRYVNTMDDPIAVMLKSATREDIAMCINYVEQLTLKRWLAIHMPEVTLTIGNVSTSHSIFSRAADPVPDNAEKVWNDRPMHMPCNIDRKLNVWDPLAMHLMPFDPNLFIDYAKQVGQKPKKGKK